MMGMAGQACSDPSGTIQILSVTSGSVNLLCDLYLLVLPLPAIAKLSLPRRRKTGLLLIFMTGTGGCVMSALALFFRSQAGGRDTSMWNRDVTYNNGPVMTVTIVESAVGVMIPCMASCAKVFNHTSGSVSSYFSSRLTGFRRTTSSENVPRVSHELKQMPKDQKLPQLDTIDRMLGQFKPSMRESELASEQSRSSKGSQM
ncbi:hypothetical protein FB567DRAFT_524021 [Paraphoma chrysanthemicola]|uniref:Rhodopsin domain-containing protein n=1 Tax=Paraphoma chrysanthemicola TaxID=798071 RepID=A0A8K0VYT1_9PLEO|nr:hypothetical protein FB567DRAFT_524021 [Paraphoma chrysanthemicola]